MENCFTYVLENYAMHQPDSNDHPVSIDHFDVFPWIIFGKTIPVSSLSIGENMYQDYSTILKSASRAELHCKLFMYIM